MTRRLLLALASLWPFARARASGPVQSVRDGLWSDPGTWGGVLPTAADDVTIRHTVAADVGTARLTTVEGAGNLLLAGTLDLHGSLVVHGWLSGSQGRLRFHVADDRMFVGNAANQADPHAITPGDIGLWAAPGSHVALTGPEVTPWVYASSIEVSVASLVTLPVGWQVGDTLLLMTPQGASGTTTLRGFNGGTVAYDAQPLAQAEITVEGETLRPIVANLSRRLVIEGADVTEAEAWHRAHTVAVHPAQFRLAYVELRNLGPRGKLGRYPVHLHHVPAETGAEVTGCSIWQAVSSAGNRFVAIHETQGASVVENVGYRSQGHAFYMERGTETWNTLALNLSVDVRAPNEIIPASEYYFQTHVYHYWSFAGNTLIGNVAVGPGTDAVFSGVNDSVGVSGMIVLPSLVAGQPVAVSQEDVVYGVPGYALRPYVDECQFVDGVAAFCGAIGLSSNLSYDPNHRHSGVVFRRCFLYENGNGVQPISKTYGAQVLCNGTFRTVLDECLVVGRYGIHTHADHPSLIVRNCRFVVTRFLKPRNWESLIIVGGTEIVLVNRLKPDGTLLEAAKLLQAHTVRTQCPPGLLDITGGPYAGTYGYVAKAGEAEFFGPGPVVPDGGRKVAFPDTSGFIRLPAPPPNKKWKWAVVAAGASWTGIKLYVADEVESEWSATLGTFGGYPHGFPPGVYDVRVQHPTTGALTTRRVSVVSGQVAEFGGIP